MPTPSISVLMPVWNGEAHLREAVESILNQTFRDFEFIVLDDGSTDRTLEILSEYSSDSRLRVIRLDHGGIVHALNRGIAEARAEWIARMDCDDISLPKRLELQWKAIHEHPKAIWCHTRYEVFGDPAYVPPKQQYFPRSKAMLRVRFCLHCPVAHPTVLMSKKVLLSAGGYLPEERHAEDYGLWQRMFSLGEFIGVPQLLFRVRVHNSSISRHASEIQSRLGNAVRLRFLKQFFADDAEIANELLLCICRASDRPFSLSQAFTLLKLLFRYDLLNPETAFWLVLNAVRALRHTPAANS